MAPREDLITSAVSFLQDPSVASSPLEKRIEFLKSKNLTREEIDISLARASDHAASPSPQGSSPYYVPQGYQSPPPGYPPYNPYQQWPMAPPEKPRRDWRDYFILATTISVASYGIYWLTDRYVRPLIAPPTPPQIEQDKAYIDEQFNRAFTLIETLATDTEALKDAEKERTEKLDSAINDVEAIVKQLKEASQKREDDARRIEGEIRGMKDSLPRAIDSVRDGSERQLKELSTELASLKALMSNRLGGSSNGIPSPASLSRPTYQSNESSKSTSAFSETAAGSKVNPTGVNGSATAPSFSTPSASSYTQATPPVSSANTKPSFPATTNKGATPNNSIPGWQMAMQNRSATTNGATAASGGSTNSSAAQVADGQDVVNILNT